MIRYCPHCWAENAYEANICAHCSTSLDEKGKDFVGKLLDAIGHPEPTRAVMAIEIVGHRLREVKAVNPLLDRLARYPDSMDVTTAAAAALGFIGAQRAVPSLTTLLLDPKRPLTARLAAAESLAKLGGTEARQALCSALSLPQLPRLLRRVIEMISLLEET